MALLEEPTMRVLRLVLVSGILLFWAMATPAQPDLPPAAQEVLKQIDTEFAELDRTTEAEIVRWRDRTATGLKDEQDRLCRAGQLDEAVAVRDAIRTLQAGVGIPKFELSPAVRRVYRPFEDEAAAIVRKAEDRYLSAQEKAEAELQKVQDAFCKEAKLDEAIAVRDLLKSLRTGTGTGTATVAALPDPGYVNNTNADIGKVFYYEVAGNHGSIYGTDVYTTGSHLGTAAVHCGLLKIGEKGVVRVTILPGQASYVGSTRNAVTSSGYGLWAVSFKVERGYWLPFQRGRATVAESLPKPGG